MWISLLFLTLGLSQIAAFAIPAQVKFCGNKLKGTELGKEEHYLKIYMCESLHSCWYIGRTEEQNMEHDKGWRCWSKRLDIYSHLHQVQFVKVAIYESDNHGKGDDLIGTSIVQFSDLVKLGSIITDVTDGDGQIQYVVNGI